MELCPQVKRVFFIVIFVIVRVSVTGTTWLAPTRSCSFFEIFEMKRHYHHEPSFKLSYSTVLVVRMHWKVVCERDSERAKVKEIDQQAKLTAK